MRVSAEFSHKAIGLMFMFALGATVWREWYSNVNPSKPLPRPCTLVFTSLGFTGLYIGASFAPSGAFWVTLGLVTGELITDQGILNAIDQTFKNAQQTSQGAAKPLPPGAVQHVAGAPSGPGTP